ncbi:Zeaxanthin glucosyl transferase [Acidisarcina polymorpha]|uniref:Zeaxanthin glucosyl transferase n=2 Tax=Acidisarcina polymorpha TaxID=2211140 RepID=A0A2Z5G7Y0_9BACT|nr:Zeaxanthin glucosyl transferase [Acidisarcina polymorpha]
MLPLYSHVSVLLSVARQMHLLGHEVIVLGLCDLQARVTQEEGMLFFPMCEEEYPPGSIASIFAPLRSMSGQAGTEFSIDLLSDLCKAVLRDGPRVLRQSRAQALVIDFSAKGMEAVALSMGIPYVQVSNALHSDYSGYTPFWSYDWPPDTTKEAIERNRSGLYRFAQKAAPMQAMIKHFLTDAGVTVNWNDPHALTSRLAWLTQLPSELDFPNPYWPEQLIHVGPLCEPSATDHADFPWHLLTGEPLIYVSFGTLQNGLLPLYQMIVQLARAKTCQIVLTTGGSAQQDKSEDVPGNLILVKSAPQLELLQRARLCITHGGVNTVLEALQYGVPLVVLPITNDQPGVAARVAHAEVGVFCRAEEITLPVLSRLVDEVLNNPKYRMNAILMQTALDRKQSLAHAGRIIDRAFASISTGIANPIK